MSMTSSSAYIKQYDQSYYAYSRTFVDSSFGSVRDLNLKS